MLHVIDGTWQPNEVDRRNGIVPVGRQACCDVFMFICLEQRWIFMVMFSSQGFGTTINIINGGLECNKPNGRESPQAKNRIAYYKKFAWWDFLNVLNSHSFSHPGTSMLILKMKSLAVSTRNSSQQGGQELCLFIGTRSILTQSHFFPLRTVWAHFQFKI